MNPLDPRRSRLAWAARILVTLLAVAFVVGLARGLDSRELAGRFANASPTLVVAGALCVVARFVVWDLRWRLAFRRLGPPPRYPRSLFALFGAAALNSIMPTARIAGGLLRARYLSPRARTPFAAVYGVVLFDQVAHQVVLIPITWAAFGTLAWLAGNRTLALISLGLFVVAAGLLGLGGRSQGDKLGRLTRFLADRMERRGGRSQVLLDHGQLAIATFRRLLGATVLRRQVLLLGVTVFLFNALAQWLVFEALAYRLSLLAVILGVSLGTAAGAASGAPGGVGATEAGMVLTYVALEVPQADALSATLLYRGLHYLLVLGIGLPSMLVFELRSGHWARLQGSSPPGAGPGRELEGDRPPDDLVQ